MFRKLFLLLLSYIFLHQTIAFADELNAPPTYKIGVILGLTGPAATWSKNSLRGLELAQDEVNQAGGVKGRKFELLVEDSKTEPSHSVTAYQKLVKIDGVRIIVGDIWAHLTNAIHPLSERDKVVLISPTVSDDSPELKGSYFFTMGHRVGSVKAAVASFFKLNPSIRRAGIFCYDNSWGHAYSKMWRAVAAQNGVEIVDEICAFQFGSEHRAAIAKFRQKKIDLVIAAEWTDQIARTMREQKLEAKLLGTSNITEALFVRSSDGDLVEGAYFTDWRPDEIFRTKFINRFGEEPILESQNSYEIIRSIAKALSISDVEIAESLRKVRYQGVDGLIDFSDGAFGNKSEGHLLQVKQGKIIPVK
jgi:branched-chain amino acid transport system substrate-binding protein